MREAFKNVRKCPRSPSCPHSQRLRRHRVRVVNYYANTVSASSKTTRYMRSRVERGTLFLRGQNRSTNQMSGMILEVQNRRFSARLRSARQRMCSKVFIFKKFQGAYKFIFFCEKWQKASFYLREDSPTRKF